jgi:ketopantoate hydroxymethyltransferase
MHDRRAFGAHGVPAGAPASDAGAGVQLLSTGLTALSLRRAFRTARFQDLRVADVQRGAAAVRLHLAPNLRDTTAGVPVVGHLGHLPSALKGCARG